MALNADSRGPTVCIYYIVYIVHWCFWALRLIPLRNLYEFFWTSTNTITYNGLGNDRNFGSVRGSADFGRFVSAKFCRTFCHSISCSLTIYGYKADRWYAILCNKSFPQSQQNSTIHISTTPFYVVKLSACCGEGFYIHALIL